MTKRLIILSLCFFCSHYSTFAQKIKVINAIERKWYGGVAGRSGANYTFVIQFSDFKTQPVPDTLWIAEHAIPIKTGNNHENANTKVSRTIKSVKFEINVGISKDDYADRYPVQGNEPNVIRNAPIEYKGVALLSYKVSGNPYYFTVKKIMIEYPSTNYP